MLQGGSLGAAESPTSRPYSGRATCVCVGGRQGPAGDSGAACPLPRYLYLLFCHSSRLCRRALGERLCRLRLARWYISQNIFNIADMRRKNEKKSPLVTWGSGESKFVASCRPCAGLGITGVGFFRRPPDSSRKIRPRSGVCSETSLKRRVAARGRASVEAGWRTRARARLSPSKLLAPGRCMGWSLCKSQRIKLLTGCRDSKK